MQEQQRLSLSKSCKQNEKRLQLSFVKLLTTDLEIKNASPMKNKALIVEELKHKHESQK